MDLSGLTPLELLRLNAETIVELRRQGILRTSNAPLGDYAEWLFCNAFAWQAADNSSKDIDANDAEGIRYQIKARRLIERRTSRQLGAIRRLDEANFDFLAVVLFDRNYSVLRAALIPHGQVLANAKWSKSVSAWRFILRDSVWDWDGVRDVTDALVKMQSLD